LDRYGLRLHPNKTRLIEVRKPPPEAGPKGGEGGRPGTFDLLGFTHFWGRSWKSGNWMLYRKTASSRLSRALQRIREWCRRYRHVPMRRQQAVLSMKLRGHYNYYGVIGNGRAIAAFWFQVKHVWWKWLERRSNAKRFTLADKARLAEMFPLLSPAQWRATRAANP
jgi:hypothetical protein